MSLFVLTLVLFSAFMHAGWNLFLKKSQDRLVTMATLHLVSGVYMANNIPGAKLVTFENSAHMPQVEEMELFNKTLSNFVEE